MKRPPEEILELAIRQALKNKKALSQNHLGELVSKKLREFDAAYAVTGRRAREAAAEMKEIRITTHTKTGAMPAACPCCDARLRKHYTRNLAGKSIIHRLQCPKCGYAGSGRHWAPRNYQFEWVD